MSEVATCYEAIDDLDPVMRATLGEHYDVWRPTYFVLGGIATGAIKHPGSEFGPMTLRAHPDSDQSVHRENGSTRDIDILVPDVLTDELAEAIKTNVTEVVRGSLIVSVFGLEDRKRWLEGKSRTAHMLGGWLSQRTVDAEGVLRQELPPLSQELPWGSLDAFKLELPSGSTVNMLHPVGHMMAYTMRSISGVRAKDAGKIGEMAERVLAQPQFLAELTEGKFRPWLDFACAMYDLRDGRLPEDSPLISPEATPAELAAFRWKGRLLKFLEGQEDIVNFAQGDQMQKVLNIFIGAK